MPQIYIEIDEDGNITHKTMGFKGKMCLAIGKKFKDLLIKMGVSSLSESTTPTQEMTETPMTNGLLKV